MYDIKLLDCTLRDGGYYTLWDFDGALIEEYCQLISNLPIEYIEIGYRSIEKPEYGGEFFYSPKATILKIKESLKESQKISLMINAKDCQDINFKVLLPFDKDLVKLIRIAVDFEKIDQGIEVAKSVKSLGFEVAVNIMYISKIPENHIIYERLKNIEKYVDYLYLVDSYGSMYPNELTKIIKKFKTYSKVRLGFHGHNNLELAFINSLVAMEQGVTMIDSTVLGMGRGAGNLKLELLLAYLQSKEHTDVNLNNLSHLVELFTPLQQQYKWGTSFPYMISGSYSFPQKDIMDAIEINRYSVTSLVNTMNKNDFLPLKPFVCNDVLASSLIIGGGESICMHMDIIIQYIMANPLLILIHSTSKYINKFSHVTNRQYFCVAGDELTKLDDTLTYDFIEEFIFEPSPRKINIELPQKKNYSELKFIQFIEKLHDSPLAISLQTVLDMSVNEVFLIGFDGYTKLNSAKTLYLMQETQEIISSFYKNTNIKLISLTKTKYRDLIHKSIYSKDN